MKPTKKLLSNWNLNDPKIIKQFTDGIDFKPYLIENNNYFFLMKSYPDWQDHLKNRLKILNDLNLKNVQKVIKTKDNKLYHNYKNFNHVIFKFEKGETLKDKKINIIDIRKIANLQSNLNKKLKKTISCKKDKSQKPKLQKNDDDFQKTLKNKDIDKNLFKRCLDSFFKIYKEINFDKLSKQNIHHDIQRRNIIKNKGEYKIIDFDDMCYSFLSSDIAIAICDLCVNKSKINFRYIKEYLSSYNETDKLKIYDIKNIYFFLLRRRIGSLIGFALYYKVKNKLEYINQFQEELKALLEITPKDFYNKINLSN